MNFLRICPAIAASLILATGVLAQTAVEPPPPSASSTPQPLPDVGADPDLEPQVTIINKESETVEEVRVNGELRYVRVTPRGGRTYYLVPSGNGQTFQRFDSLSTGLRVPMWLLFSW
jgi:Protein of unknown function (DUF2782)